MKTPQYLINTPIYCSFMLNLTHHTKPPPLPPQNDNIRLLGFTTLHDWRRYTIPRCMVISSYPKKTGCFLSFSSLPPPQIECPIRKRRVQGSPYVVVAGCDARDHSDHGGPTGRAQRPAAPVRRPDGDAPLDRQETRGQRHGAAGATELCVLPSREGQEQLPEGPLHLRRLVLRAPAHRPGSRIERCRLREAELEGRLRECRWRRHVPLHLGVAPDRKGAWQERDLLSAPGVYHTSRHLHGRGGGGDQ